MATEQIPPGFFRPPADPEIDALATCLRALLPLDMSARSRVIEYLDDRLQKAPGTTDGTAWREVDGSAAEVCAEKGRDDG